METYFLVMTVLLGSSNLSMTLTHCRGDACMPMAFRSQADCNKAVEEMFTIMMHTPFDWKITCLRQPGA